MEKLFNTSDIEIIDKKFDSVKKSITFFALSFVFVVLIVLVWIIKLGF